MRWIIAILFFALTSCNTINKNSDCGTFAQGWNQCTRDTAKKSFYYAQMAHNVYGDGNQFNLGPDNKLMDTPHSNDDIGFAYSIFGKYDGDQLQELVIAYRGTETGILDWWFGNILTRQNVRGLEVYDQWRQRYPEVPIVVTGHSLGGGIATRVSLCRPNVTSFVFNTSPRFRRCRENFLGNTRNSIVEYGEILKVSRLLGREPRQTYTSIDCTGGNPVRQHGMRSLAECLTRIAGLDSKVARKSLSLNSISGIEEGTNNRQTE